MSDNKKTLEAWAKSQDWWKWHPGMLAYWPDSRSPVWKHSGRVVAVNGGQWVVNNTVESYNFEPIPPDAMPDLSDLATMGCVLVMGGSCGMCGQKLPMPYPF